MKINPLTDYYKSVFSVLLRGIINNPSVSTQSSYGDVTKDFFVYCKQESVQGEHRDQIGDSLRQMVAHKMYFKA